MLLPASERPARQPATLARLGMAWLLLQSQNRKEKYIFRFGKIVNIFEFRVYYTIWNIFKYF